MVEKGRGRDLFIVKYDLMGNAKWGRNFGNGQADITKDIACDRYGFVYFVAEFGDSILDISQYNLFTKGGKDVCIVKMDTIGNVVWANSIGGLRDDYVSSIVINESEIPLSSAQIFLRPIIILRNMI